MTHQWLVTFGAHTRIVEASDPDEARDRYGAEFGVGREACSVRRLMSDEAERVLNRLRSARPGGIGR